MTSVISVQISQATSIAKSFLDNYRAKTPENLKLLDIFSACSLLAALLQFSYAVVVGSFPFNSFLAGFFCSLGCFVLTTAFRMQLDPQNSSGTLVERAFADYIFAMCVLFLAVWNYVG